ncbi:hypothetical protein FSP39_011357 [Pinctada imbricata]|uniref:Angiomotin C-terminal domain-containing protein n=1 Tax=Pinctada imbricata TaxID=66713 RepID=A0AA88YEN4_PINIB|nr:hypothetical protein FSP39_011357 [Pinctada imbricata]
MNMLLHGQENNSCDSQVTPSRDGVTDSPTYANVNMLQDLLNGQYSSEEYLDLIVTNSEAVTMAQQSQYREPPPYPGHSKQMVNNTPGLRQSFSGSETSTDVSVSSTENLSTSQRQEPQGEENQSSQALHTVNMSDTEYSILARLGMPATALEPKTVSSQPYYNMASGHGHCLPYPTDHAGYLNNPCCGSSFSWHSHSANTLYPPAQKSVPKTSDFTTQDVHVSNVYSSPHWTGAPVDQLQSAYFTHLPPPPEYPGSTPDRPELRRSYETVGKSDIADLTACKSQPDLSKYWEAHNKQLQQYYAGANVEHSSPQREDQSTPTASMRYEESPYDPLTERANKMIDMLTDENRKLREELNIFNRKVSRLQKFELEIQKVHEAYEGLVRSSKKREQLELIMKKRLEEEIKKLQTKNKQLQEQVDRSPASEIDFSHGVTDSQVAVLIAKNKELLDCNEKLELELKTHRVTIQEQQSKIDILDNALTNAQANVVRLEKECCKKQVQMERLEQLQKSFSSLQAACEKREQMEKQLRTRLEKELDTLKSQQKSGTTHSEPNVQKDPTSTDTTNLYSLQRLLNEKEAKILKLETETIKWEQKYLEENALRQIGCVSDFTSQFDSSVLDEDKVEKLKQLEGFIQARQQVSDLEAKVKSLQTELAEKDAMIKVFQRSPMTRSSSVHTLYCTPVHSPRPSPLTTASLTRQGKLPTIRHVKTGSTSALETGHTFSLDEDLASHIQHLNTESKDSNDSSEDDGTEKVWQV